MNARRALFSVWRFLKEMPCVAICISFHALYGCRCYAKKIVMITNVVNTIQVELTQTFEEVFNWLTIDNGLLNYSPDNKRWGVRKILENISLTNHYLLVLIRKGAVKAIEKSEKTDYAALLVNYDLDW